MFIFHIASTTYVFNMVSEQAISYPAHIWATCFVASLCMSVLPSIMHFMNVFLAKFQSGFSVFSFVFDGEWRNWRETILGCPNIAEKNSIEIDKSPNSLVYAIGSKSLEKAAMMKFWMTHLWRAVCGERWVVLNINNRWIRYTMDVLNGEPHR